MRYGLLILSSLVPVLAHSAPEGHTFADPGWDEERCGRLTVSTGSLAGVAGDRRVDGFGASLAGVGAQSAVVARLRASELRTFGAPSLDTLPALFAGGLLVTVERHRLPDCDLEHAFRRSAEDAASLPEGAQADQRWTGLRVQAEGDVYEAATLRLHAQNDKDGLTRISEEATGLSSAGNGSIAHASIRVAMAHDRLVSLAEGHPLAAGDVVTIERLVLSSQDTLVEASGEVQPAQRAGHLMVRAENMEGIKDALPVGDRERAGAAFLVMRLAAKQEANGTLAWDVVWNDDGVTINGVALPFHL